MVLFLLLLWAAILATGLLVSFLYPDPVEICTTPTCFCEVYFNESITLRPVSFYSCFSFHIVAVLIIAWYFKWPEWRPYWYVLAYVFYMSCIGSFSMIYHAQHSYAGEYVDGLSISLYAWFVFSLGTWWFKTVLSLGSLVVVGLMFIPVFTTPLFGIIVGLAFVRLVWTGQRAIAIPLAFLIPAVVLWVLSQDAYGCQVWYGHGIWHILTAITAGLLFLVQRIDLSRQPPGIKISDEGLLLAGAYQYKQVWARDTCYSLIVLKEGGDGTYAGIDMVKAARAYLEIYIANRRNQRGVETYELGWCCPSMRMLGWTCRFGPRKWLGWGYTSAAADILAELVCLMYHLEYMNIIFPTPDMDSRGFVTQGPFSDFQDSRDRSPVAFLTNLFWWKVLQLRNDSAFKGFDRKMRNEFFTGFFYGKRYPALEDQLFAILLGFDTSVEYKARVRSKWELSKSPLTEEYGSEVPLKCLPRLVGLKHYHDTIEWPWLAYFYAGTFRRKPSVPKEYETSEIVWSDHCLYSPEQDFLMSYAFREYYLHSIKL